MVAGVGCPGPARLQPRGSCGVPRRLINCLVLSLIVHGALLLEPPVDIRWSGGSPGVPLRASLVKKPIAPKATASVDAAHAELMPSPRAAPDRESVRKTIRHAKEGADSPIAGTGDSRKLAPQLDAGLVFADEGVLNANDVRLYRLNLAAEAGLFVRNQPAGWRPKLPGRVILEVLVASEGWRQVRLLESSGNPVLNEAATAMMTQAVRMSIVPAALSGQGFRLTIPVEFSADN